MNPQIVQFVADNVQRRSQENQGRSIFSQAVCENGGNNDTANQLLRFVGDSVEFESRRGNQNIQEVIEGCISLFFSSFILNNPRLHNTVPQNTFNTIQNNVRLFEQKVNEMSGNGGFGNNNNFGNNNFNNNSSTYIFDDNNNGFNNQGTQWSSHMTSGGHQGNQNNYSELFNNQQGNNSGSGRFNSSNYSQPQSNPHTHQNVPEPKPLEPEILTVKDWSPSIDQPYRILPDINGELVYERRTDGVIMEKQQHAGGLFGNMSSMISSTEKSVEELNEVDHEVIEKEIKLPKPDNEKALKQKTVLDKYLFEDFITGMSLADILIKTKIKLSQCDNIGNVLYRVYGITYLPYIDIEDDFLDKLKLVTNFEELKDVLSEDNSPISQEINRRLTKEINELILYTLALPEASLNIDDFKTDIEDLEEHLRTNYSSVFYNAFKRYECKLIASFMKPDLPDHEQIIVDKINEPLKEEVEINLIPTTYSITLLNMTFNDLSIKLDKNEALLVEPETKPHLHDLIATTKKLDKKFTTPGGEVIPSQHNILITNDNVVLKIHDALKISEDRYLVQRSNISYI